MSHRPARIRERALFLVSDGEIRGPSNTRILNKQKKKGELKEDDRNYKEESKIENEEGMYWTMYNCVYEVDNDGSTQCVVFCGHRALLRVKEEPEQLWGFFFPSSDQMLFTLFVLAVMMFSFSSFLFRILLPPCMRAAATFGYIRVDIDVRKTHYFQQQKQQLELKAIMAISRSVSFNLICLINTHFILIFI